MMTRLKPALSNPSTCTPFEEPVASMIVLAAPAPSSASGRSTMTLPAYFPLATLTVSPGAAELIALWIVLTQPLVPLGFTHQLPPNAGIGNSRMAAQANDDFDMSCSLLEAEARERSGRNALRDVS